MSIKSFDKKPTTFKFNNLNVYLAEDVYNYDSTFFPGCSMRLRNMIEKKRLTENIDYIWAYKTNNNTWVKTTAKYNKAKLLLIDNYVNTHVPKFKGFVEEKDYKYPIAPEILDLEESEKFKDNNNNVINIEVRGERKVNECYFRLTDVSIGFNLPYLHKNIIDKDTLYLENAHYKYFSIDKKCHKDSNFENNLNNKKYSQYEIFITYKGMLKILFSSRSGDAEKFTDWATQKLFTIHLGEEDDKQELSASLLGCDTKTIKNVFSTNSSKSTSCIYLFCIGNANKLLNTDKYKDNDIIAKFGYTDNLIRRTNEHSKTFKHEFKSNIELLIFSIIDPVFLSKAEILISKYFDNDKLEYKNFKELIVINTNELSNIKEQYNLIQNSYIGSYLGLYNQINDLKLELETEKNKNIILNKDILLLTEKYENKLKDKDIELLNYKIKYLENIK